MDISRMIGWAVFGLVAGALARLLHPGRDPMNWVWTMVLGLLGAVVGGWLGTQVLGVNANNGLMSWVFAVVGAVLLLVGYNMLTGRGAGVGDTSTTTAATGDDYKKAVFDDLSRGPNG
ncbi:MAG: GlsB/YeaQ/YmgE family stress response membrane protein [Singulisphaera sp.]